MLYYTRINFVVWLSNLIISFWIDHIIIDIIFLITTIGFIIELIIAYKESDNFKDFIKNNYIDILLLIPIFKLVKFTKIAKVFKLKKVFRGLDVFSDIFELVLRFFRR